MYNSTKSFGFETIYIRLKDLGSEYCPFCESKVEELYPDAGHSFVTLRGWRNLITFWYRCTNPECPSGGKIKAPQPYVLPYKKFGQDVWLNICFEWEKWKTTPFEISERLGCQGVYISEDAVSEILIEYKLLKNKQVNQKTMETIRAQGKMVLAMDGTPTETGYPALWTFYDGISGRLLYAEMLNSADKDSLKTIFHDIKDRYNVPIVAFLSDHQPSIVNACEDFDASIPHQTCQYHFLKNHWNFLMAKDNSMNSELENAIEKLSICLADTNGGAQYSKGTKVDKKIFFQQLGSRLRRSVKQKNDEFNCLKGVKAYQKVSEIATEIDSELKTLDVNLRPTLQLASSQRAIITILKSLKPQYEELYELNNHFQEIRKILGDDTIEKIPKIQRLDELYSIIYTSYSPATQYKSRSDIKSSIPKPDMDKGIIACQWCRLWDSHKKNLFFYYDVNGLEKTNIYNEQLFSILKRQLVHAHGQAHKNYMVITQGEIYLTDICDKKSVSIHEVLSSYDLKEITRLYEPIQKKITFRRAGFRNSKMKDTAISDIAERIRKKDWEVKKKKN